VISILRKEVQSATIVSTPHFGGCLKERSGALTCVLGPHHCLADEVYLAPYQHTTPQCQNPQELQRCEGSVFKNDDGLYCLTLKNKDCSSTSKTKTGICYFGQETDLASTASSYASFCAIGEYDCPIEYSFMNADDLEDTINPPRTCQVCTEATVPSSSEETPIRMHGYVVTSGGCFASDSSMDFLKCALESTDCTEGQQIFMSSDQLFEEMKIVPCPSTDLQVGACAKMPDDSIVDYCSNNEESCPYDLQYDTSSSKSQCTIHSNIETEEPTWFGHCESSTKRRCVWDKSECQVGVEEWVRPKSKLSTGLEGCSCEHVETGACFINNQFHCAVSKYACADINSYVSSHELHTDYGYTCHLCQPQRKQAVTPPDDTTNPPTNNDDEDFNDKKKRNSDDIGNSLAWELSLAAAALMSTVFLIVYTKTRKPKSQSTATTAISTHRNGYIA